MNIILIFENGRVEHVKILLIVYSLVKHQLLYWIPPVMTSSLVNSSDSFPLAVFSWKDTILTKNKLGSLKRSLIYIVHIGCRCPSVCADDAMSPKYFPSSSCGILSNTDSAPCNLDAIPMMEWRGQTVKYDK